MKKVAIILIEEAATFSGVIVFRFEVPGPNPQTINHPQSRA
jgi:hypothetical protein